jgi:hypothetical protein
MDEKAEDNSNQSRAKIKELINYFDSNSQNSNSIKKTETAKNNGNAPCC